MTKNVEQRDHLTSSLFERLKDPLADNSAWGCFIRIYRPIVEYRCRYYGIEEDGDDVMQEFLLRVRGEQCPCTRDAFRPYAYVVLRNLIIDRRRAKAARRTARLDDVALDLLPAPEEEKILDQCVLRGIVDVVKGEVDAVTWRAFEATMLCSERVEGEVIYTLREKNEGTSEGTVKAVAAEMGRTPGWVYRARDRVRDKFKEFEGLLRD